MISVGAWRWPLVLALCVVTASALAMGGLARLHFEGQATLMPLNNGSQKTSPIVLRAEAPWPSGVVQRLNTEGQARISDSITKRRGAMQKTIANLQTRHMDFEKRFNQLMKDREALLAGPRRGTPKAVLVAKIEELKARRRLLIEHYPTHTDIPLLANQIKDLLKQMGRRPAPLAEKVTDFDRQINETKLRMDYVARIAQNVSRAEQSLKPEWKMAEPITKPRWPNRVDGWPVALGGIAAVFALAAFVFSGKQNEKQPLYADGLWKPEPSDSPVMLRVVSPESETAVAAPPESNLPMDPMTEKAAALYSKWVDISKILYEPAKEPPQGVLDQVSPLLQESSEFLPEGHDVMARYLARSVTPGDLAAHVARTVLMTLTGAQEAGVSPEHRLAMALAALFHDLAVVPRPIGHQDNVGSEVGRLSASVLRRIPGLQPALLSMVEDILIGMDEFKLETWQNAANESTLEPLSKVLREIDRFEKVMQKQKSRLDRRVANQ